MYSTTHCPEGHEGLKTRIITALYDQCKASSWGSFAKGPIDSAVLFLLGYRTDRRTGPKTPCIILNKRSQRVKQPGDLCFPGGRTALPADPLLAKLLRIPFSPLVRWPYWGRLRRQHPEDSKRLAILVATGLRESAEEMGLSPFGLSLLGPMPAQEVSMFARVIHPLVVWVSRQTRFFPNWEVERIVHIPLEDLLRPEHYGICRISIQFQGPPQEVPAQDFPCFVHEDHGGVELLWGATFKIVMVFLKAVFEFEPPKDWRLPVYHRSLDAAYMNGPANSERGHMGSRSDEVSISFSLDKQGCFSI